MVAYLEGCIVRLFVAHKRIVHDSFEGEARVVVVRQLVAPSVGDVGESVLCILIVKGLLEGQLQDAYRLLLVVRQNLHVCMVVLRAGVLRIGQHLRTVIGRPFDKEAVAFGKRYSVGQGLVRIRIPVVVYFGSLYA